MQNKTARTGQPEQNQPEWERQKTQPERDSQNRTARMGQPVMDNQKGKARIGQPERDSQNRGDRTGLPSHDCQHKPGQQLRQSKIWTKHKNVDP
jgi:hypothetical protein